MSGERPTGDARDRLIVFQGLDGAGKTTQARLLIPWLASFGRSVGEFVGVNLGWLRVLLEEIARETGSRDYVELLGADAARVAVAIVSLQEMRTGLLPLLGMQGGFVVADGYTHGHYLLARENGASNEWLLRRLLRSLPSPDLVVFLDVSPETAKRRVEQRGIDDEELAHLERIHALWRELPEFSTFEVVGAEEPVEIVQERVRACVARAFPELHAAAGRT
jgi:dTMP kinase